MSDIKQFYAGKNILITGATGFVGKVIVEKILNACDDVNSVYLIIRSNKNKFDQRSKDYLNHLVFDNIRNNKPQQFQKVKIFNGDLTKDELALNNYELKEIYEHVHIVLHCGANVRFDLSLHDALNSNTFGTYRMLEISKRIKHLQVFAFISTSYSQPYLDITDECHYTRHIDSFMLLRACNNFDDSTIEALQEKILGEFPNTYTLSKHLSEELVYQYRNEFPICVIRPSVVVSAVKDPMPNYCEGINGYFGFGMGVMRGVIRTYYVEKEAFLLTIPVDEVANTVITTSWLHATKQKDQIEFYNASVNHENSMMFKDFIDTIMKKVRFTFALDYAIWFPNGSITKCIYYHYIRVVLCQIIPAICIDLLLRLFCQRAIMMKVQRKIFGTAILLAPFLRSNIQFSIKRYLSIQDYQNELDRKIFCTRPEKWDFDSLAFRMAYGIRKYICNEKDEDVPRALIITKILCFVNFVSQTIVLYFVANFIWKRYCNNLWL